MSASFTALCCATSYFMIIASDCAKAHAQAAINRGASSLQSNSLPASPNFLALRYLDHASTALYRAAITRSQAFAHLFFAMMCEITQQLGSSFRDPLPCCVFIISSAFHSLFLHSVCLRWV